MEIKLETNRNGYGRFTPPRVGSLVVALAHNAFSQTCFVLSIVYNAHGIQLRFTNWLILYCQRGFRHVFLKLMLLCSRNPLCSPNLLCSRNLLLPEPTARHQR